MNFVSATHVRYLPTGEVARIVTVPPAQPASLKSATLRGEFVNGRQEELRRTLCTVLGTAAGIAEYQRTRCWWPAPAFFNPPAPDNSKRTV